MKIASRATPEGLAGHGLSTTEVSACTRYTSPGCEIYLWLLAITTESSVVEALWSRESCHSLLHRVFGGDKTNTTNRCFTKRQTLPIDVLDICRSRSHFCCVIDVTPCIGWNLLKAGRQTTHFRDTAGLMGFFVPEDVWIVSLETFWTK